MHDHLLSRKGIAAPTNHPLRLAVERHKARLQAELTKSRIRRGCATIEDLKTKVEQQKKTTGFEVVQPRWVRVNSLKSTVLQQLSSTFKEYTKVSKLSNLTTVPTTSKNILRDPHVPDLLALPPGTDLSKTQAYKSGEIIFQDKASCFPAYLLLGECLDRYDGGDVIDACAAPGNKTTHLASILTQSIAAPRIKIFACERDSRRSQILQTMVSLAGADKYVTVLAKQDFLALDPNDARFANVTHLLLDPSCSGSGIVGREDVPSLALPNNPKDKQAVNGRAAGKGTGKKRKRGREDEEQSVQSTPAPKSTMQDANLNGEEIYQEVDLDRLDKLATLQSKIIEHAFAFPVATKITYSTCSIHVRENECVVTRVLDSNIAKQRRWRVLRREEQPVGLRRWVHRGMSNAAAEADPPGREQGFTSRELSEEESEACIRSQAMDGKGTMGFFVCGFVKNTDDEEEWAGISDGET